MGRLCDICCTHYENSADSFRCETRCSSGKSMLKPTASSTSQSFFERFQEETLQRSQRIIAFVQSIPPKNRTKEQIMSLAAANNNFSDFRLDTRCVCGKTALKYQRTLEYPALCKECWKSERYRPNRVCEACGKQEADWPGCVYPMRIVDWRGEKREALTEILCEPCHSDYKEFSFRTQIWGIGLEFSKWLAFKDSYDFAFLQRRAQHLDALPEVNYDSGNWCKVPKGYDLVIRSNFGSYMQGIRKVWVNHSLVIVRDASAIHIGYSDASMVYTMFAALSYNLKHFTWTYPQECRFGMNCEKLSLENPSEEVILACSAVINQGELVGRNLPLKNPYLSVYTDEHGGEGSESKLVFKNRQSYF